MRYSKVFIESFGYELAPYIVTSREIEEKLRPFLDFAGFETGQLEILTGIRERRYWNVDHTLAEHAAEAGLKAIKEADFSPDRIGTLVFCGVGQDGFEPATSCMVADSLDIGKNAHVYDIKNACLGAITGIVSVANEIELGNIEAGLVVTCETARQIVDSTIDEINGNKSVEFYKKTVATMTGGSGAAAVLLTNGKVGGSSVRRHAIKGGVVRNAVEHHGLCRWGFEEKGMPTDSKIIMRTNAEKVFEYGMKLGIETFESFRKEFDLSEDKPDRFITHQIGALHHQKFCQIMDIDMGKFFLTFPFLGNIGTVSLPITAAIADERGFLTPGDFVAFLGIGSGLNCYILGVEW